VAVVYGGFTRRNFFRDMDVAIYTGGLVEDPLSLESDLCIELSKVLRIPVDTRVVDDAPPWFKLKVLTSGMVVYERKPGASTLLLKEAVGICKIWQLNLQLTRKSTRCIGLPTYSAR